MVPRDAGCGEIAGGLRRRQRAICGLTWLKHVRQKRKGGRSCDRPPLELQNRV